MGDGDFYMAGISTCACLCDRAILRKLAYDHPLISLSSYILITPKLIMEVINTSYYVCIVKFLSYIFFLAPFLPPFVNRLFLPTAMVDHEKRKGSRGERLQTLQRAQFNVEVFLRNSSIINLWPLNCVAWWAWPGIPNNTKQDGGLHWKMTFNDLRMKGVFKK